MINIFRIQCTQITRFFSIEWSNLDLMVQDGVWKFLEKHVIDGHVHGWDDFLGIANQLAIESHRTFQNDLDRYSSLLKQMGRFWHRSVASIVPAHKV